MLCQYRDIFGKVGEGVHSYRVFNVAIVDVLLTIALACVVYMFMPGYNFLYILIGLFLLGIVAHRVFCVRTTVDKVLFREL